MRVKGKAPRSEPEGEVAPERVDGVRGRSSVRIDRVAIRRRERGGRQRIEDARKASLRAVVFGEVHVGRTDHAAGIAVAHPARSRTVPATFPHPGRDGAVGMSHGNGGILECAIGAKRGFKVQIVVGGQRRGIGSCASVKIGIEVAALECDLDRPRHPRHPVRRFWSKSAVQRPSPPRIQRSRKNRPTRPTSGRSCTSTGRRHPPDIGGRAREGKIRWIGRIEFRAIEKDAALWRSRQRLAGTPGG